MDIVLWLLLGWAVCGVLAYGITFAYFNAEFKDLVQWTRQPDRYVCIASIMASTGPAGLIVAVFKSGFCKNGLRYRFPRLEE